jgi:prepilin-type N-terminal cleavage/methylation domain-containing protein
MKRLMHLPDGGFTLIEILLASAVAALILVAIYGLFQHAIRLQDSATQRVRESRLRLRAADIIRNDLRNALVSGGLFASIVLGDSAGTDGMTDSSFPGYLKITTTTATDTPDDLYGDVQQVEYYIVKDSSNTAPEAGGILVRAVTRDLLDTTEPQAEEQQILTGVQSFQVSFFDGANWQTSWAFNSADSVSGTSTGASAAPETLPQAIRVDIQQAALTVGAGRSPAPGSAVSGSPSPTPPEIEILVPWTTVPFTSPTPAPSASPS